MAERLSRQELYDRVWSEPMRTLAAAFGISDVALKKACARAHVPTPERGYWAKKEAGKPTRQALLPPRPPGMNDEVQIGGGNSWYWNWSREELLGPIPPQFDEPLEQVRERIAPIIGKVSVPRQVRDWHPVIARLLAQDEGRRQKQQASLYPFSWDDPLFDTPHERRRMRILNSLFLASAKVGGKPTIRGREARDIHVTFHHQHVGLALDPPASRTTRGRQSDRSSASDQLRLEILTGLGSQEARKAWTDDEHGKLESRMTEIAIELALTAEHQHRESAIRHHQWRIERAAQIEEEDRQRRAEAERAERERQERLEQARIDRLLKDADAFRKANEIRNYVAALTARIQENSKMDLEDLERWREWALAQADRIDPAVGRDFLNARDDL